MRARIAFMIVASGLLMTGCSPGTNASLDPEVVEASTEEAALPSTEVPDPRPSDGAVPWSHPDGTTHWYEEVYIPDGITWVEADEAARAAGGYLATITSMDENAFVFALVDRDELWFQRPNGVLAGPWLGGIQSEGSQEPDGGWTWVTKESFSYVNWSAREPNEMNNVGQDRLHFGEVRGMRVSSWNDIRADQTSIRGYVIEYGGGHSASPEPGGQSEGPTTVMSEAFIGYTLFTPTQSKTTYLIDIEGTVVHTWESSHPPGQAVYLLENGNLLRTGFPGRSSTFGHTGGIGGLVQEFARDGSVEWEFWYSSETYLLHHDIEPMPNGNVLMIAWELKTKDEAIAAGRREDLLEEGGLWPDHIIEVQPTGPNEGVIVWEWHIWEHLIQDSDPTKPNYGVVAEHPELININFVQGKPGADWTHTNGIDYNEDLDQIMLSVHNFNEIWVIDHSTTTTEAAGHAGGTSGMGGDLLYRWGNPRAYRAGDRDDQQLFGQHDAQWIAGGIPGEGNVLIFNNGMGRPDGEYSTVLEITLPDYDGGSYVMAPGPAYGPSEPIWMYIADPPTDFYSAAISGVERMPNGNTLVCSGSPGLFFEVTPEGDLVWEYQNTFTGGRENGRGGDDEPRYSVFKIRRYALDYPGLDGLWQELDG